MKKKKLDLVVSHVSTLLKLSRKMYQTIVYGKQSFVSLIVCLFFSLIVFSRNQRLLGWDLIVNVSEKSTPSSGDYKVRKTPGSPGQEPIHLNYSLPSHIPYISNKIMKMLTNKTSYSSSVNIEQFSAQVCHLYSGKLNPRSKFLRTFRDINSRKYPSSLTSSLRMYPGLHDISSTSTKNCCRGSPSSSARLQQSTSRMC